MLGSAIILFLALRRVIYTAADQRSFEVSQSPNEMVVAIGGNATFYCVFSIVRDKSTIKVYWWKEGEKEYQRSDPARRKRFGLRGKASFYFELYDATIQDSGVYRCSVIRQDSVRINGSGSHLIVYAVPTPLRLFRKTPEGSQSTAHILVCETAAFYPENINLTWYKNGVEITLGTQVIKAKNTGGLYVASSSLTSTQPFHSDDNYTCMVSHLSLKIPAAISYSVANEDALFKSSIFSYLRYCLALLMLLIIIGILRTHCQLPLYKWRKSDGPAAACGTHSFNHSSL